MSLSDTVDVQQLQARVAFLEEENARLLKQLIRQGEVIRDVQRAVR